MDNHVHLLATGAADGALSQMMQWLGARYTKGLNFQRGRTGTLWEGRFHSSAITSERYFLICQRYIELNPVRAGIVRDPAEFAWSSYRHNAFGVRDPVLLENEIYLRLGPSGPARQGAYRGLFGTPLEESELAAVRLSIHLGRPLADADRAISTRRRGRPRKNMPETIGPEQQSSIQL